MKLKQPGRRRLALLAPALALLTIPFSAGSASAYSPGWDPNTHPDPIGACNGRGPSINLCQYHEVNAWTALGKRHQASNVSNNCAGTDPQTYQVNWKYTTNSSYSYANTQSLEVSFGFSKDLEEGMKASTSSTETWTVGDQREAGSVITNTIRPGYAGAYWFAPYVRHSQGWVEVHYNKKQFGHWDWFYPYRGSNQVHIDTPVAWSDGSIKGQLYWATWKC
ncbi:hypothetical protein GCM10022403_030120 [Streptomyces coacervatus]|uniref:Secreted protein n=1 Tax=Streptomyces coacervatus TaxID=647381 RepID=A0ABP7HKP7_9ACTN|nr:hypothetical protein [Streptomyces coacervatus]MDF2271495.1 hypothetical protein [Streptomyces coacervatus]